MDDRGQGRRDPARPMTQLVVLIPGVALTRAAANALAVVPAGSAAPIRTAVLLLAE